MIAIEPMTADHWPDVRRIYAEGIATGDATLEREAPDWNHFDHSHPPVCRLVARDGAGGPVVGWTALGHYSARRVYSGVAWESVYVAETARGRGVGRALLEALIPASEAAGFWTLLAGVLVDNARQPRPPRGGRVPPRRRPARDGPGRAGPLARRRPARTTERGRRSLTARIVSPSAEGRRHRASPPARGSRASDVRHPARATRGLGGGETDQHLAGRRRRGESSRRVDRVTEGREVVTAPTGPVGPT